ncbi:uncharacterized protein H6S33_010606 [Morchella sextelata]|uniref:uncharacterized protein n=1 Tax=Morchella sextelata TaxID=1174677 RepID=UPI001D046A2C|nr:uncharacterized protein H6S33_010606 [Morchella sextelata]KAH0611341.1 hypothetical protein H6S33_010606 [Morchella sextelata]
MRPTPDLHRTPSPSPTPTLPPRHRSFSEPGNPPLTPGDHADLEALHRTLDTLLSPTTKPTTVTEVLTTFRQHLDTPHYLLPTALHQRTSTLARKLRTTAAALAHANRVNTRLAHLHATLQAAAPAPAPAPHSQRQRHVLRATASVRRRPLVQRLAEVLGGREQYENVVDAGVLAVIVRLGKTADREAGVLEGRLRLVRGLLDGFWGPKEQAKGEVLWGVFVAEARVRVEAVNLWAVEEANRVWVMRAVGRRIVGGWV